MQARFERFPGRQVLLLDGIWDFAWCGDRLPEDVIPGELTYTTLMAVPGCFDAGPAYAGQRGTGVYRRPIELPGTGFSHGVLHLGGLGLRAVIYWDGQRAGSVDLPYSGISMELPACSGTLHELVIAVDNRFDTERMPLFHPNYDFYAYGGIYRSLSLHGLSERFFRRMCISTIGIETPEVRVDLEIEGVPDGMLELMLSVDSGNAAMHVLKVEAGQGHLVLPLPGARLWYPEDPALHTITARMPGDCIRERFGIRTVEAREGRILINGSPVKLLGYNRHEAHPEFGPALPAQIEIEDLQILKDLGCNFIRGSHYPQNQRFLDLCDEMGFLVWEECLGWGDPAERIADPFFQKKQLEQAHLMVRNSFNHPSVIIWGFLNEGASHDLKSRPLYEALATQIRGDDPSRLVTFGSMHGENDVCMDLMDIVAHNCYPGWYNVNDPDIRPLDSIAQRLDALVAHARNGSLQGKPVIISEIGGGGLYGFRDRLKARWSEEYQADILEAVCRYVMASPGISGLALWQYCDARTYATGGILNRPRGFNNKGTLDEYRRPKMAYDTVKRIFRGGKKNVWISRPGG